MVFEESTTYQLIVWKGRLLQARRMVFLLGRKRFGPAEEPTTAALYAIEDVQQLEELCERILDVESWQELFQPAKRRWRGGRPKRNA
jgi:hypothetical protein